MTTRHPLPGGQWADLLDPDELSGADQDAFYDRYDELIQAVPQPAPQPDPANPAVMLPAPPRQMGRAGNRALQDWILAKAITGWSFALDLPYRAEYRTMRGGDGKPVLPLPACNALVKAAERVQNALVDATDDEDEAGDGPKSGPPSGTGGSEGTSPDGSPSPLPAPPAVTSGTP
jgi:hypothetical protein